MIPAVIWPWWPWIRAALPYVAAGLAVWYVMDLRGDLRDARAELAAQEARYKAQAAEVDRENRNAKEGLQQELDRLRANARGPVPVVRLCVRPPAEVPGVPTLTGGTGDAGTAGGSVPRVPDGDSVDGRDYGPGLYWLADDADRRAAQLRHLLERNRKLAEIASGQP